MTKFRFIIRSIVFYRNQHLALFLSMAVSTAILTGAFVVGDSIRFSLKQMVNSRLGKTQFALVGGSRFMDAGLAKNLSHKLQVPVAPILLLQGIVIEPDSGTRVNRAAVIGIDSSFAVFGNSTVAVPGQDEAVIGQSLADRLHVAVGEEVLLRVESPNLIPVNAPFAREPDPTIAFRLTVKAIASDNQLGRFNLANDQSTIYNIFVSITFLSQKLDLSGLSNVMLVAGDQHTHNTSDIKQAMQSVWTLKDLGLALEDLHEKGTYKLTSNRVFIDTIVERTLKSSAIPYEEVLTYLVNDLEVNGHHTPYSFASAVPSTMSGNALKDNEVVINKWTSDDLGARVGDSIRMTYYEIGPMRDLREKTMNLVIRNIIPDRGGRIDSSLMPKFQGLSEAGNCRDWDAGVPVDMKLIRDKDEDYWDTYRGTPKVLLSVKAGRQLWKNPFGSLTAIYFHEDHVTKTRVAEVLLRTIHPNDIGIQLADVRNEGTTSAGNAVNFTELFLGMSFFIIAAGIMLTVLIFSLHFSRRSSESALLSGIGYSTNAIIRLRFAESSFVIVLGSFAGSLLGILYNKVLIAGLNTVWNDMVRFDMLEVHVKGTSLLLGALISCMIAFTPIYRVTVRKLKLPVARHLRVNVEMTDFKPSRKRKRKLAFGYGLLLGSMLLVFFSIAVKAIDNAVLYLTAAAMVLAGCLLVINVILTRTGSSQVVKLPTLGILAWKNLQRNPARSLSVIALLSLGTFTLVLTGSYRKTYYGQENLRSSGTGGYLLWAETTSPIPFDLNRAEGKNRLILDGQDDLNEVRFLQFDRLEGDDASCLNLNQAQHPRILAVDPTEFDSAGAFSFARVLSQIPADRPWNGLEKALNDSTFPAFADQTVLQYSLKRKLGDTLIYRNEAGKNFRLVLAGALDNSVFQGHILIADTTFRKQFPSSGGSKAMLIDAPEGKSELITRVLTQSLVDYGVEVTPTIQRLATFNSVENTYLTVFMSLSGLGFILATVGLGIVLLRNVYERKRELALLISLGYSQKQVFNLVFTENLYLLSTGFVIGILAAIIGILPSLVSPSFKIQGGFAIILTASIFISSLLWILLPLRSALKKPLIQALRND